MWGQSGASALRMQNIALEESNIDSYLNKTHAPAACNSPACSLCGQASIQVCHKLLPKRGGAGNCGQHGVKHKSFRGMCLPFLTLPTGFLSDCTFLSPIRLVALRWLRHTAACRVQLLQDWCVVTYRHDDCSRRFWS